METCDPDDPDWDPLWEEEGKKKREARVSFTTEQISILETHYEVNPFPKAALREEIGDELGLTSKKVEVWFKNRRAKAKRDGVLKTVKQVKLKFLVIFLREKSNLLNCELQGTSLAENQLNLPNESNENKGVKYNKTGGNARRVHSSAPENNNFEVMEKCKMSSQNVMNDHHPLIMISPEF